MDKISTIDMLLIELFGPSVLAEAQIPHSHYGYWIDPDGDYHAVDMLHGHEKMAAQIAPEAADPVYELFLRGWVRIVGTDQSGELSIAVNEPSRRAMLALVRLVRSLGPKGGYYVLTKDDDRRVHDMPQLLRLLNSIPVGAPVALAA